MQGLHLLVIESNGQTPWWQNFMKEYGHTRNRGYMLNIYKSHHATPIDDGQRILGLQFESDHYRTLFLMKYG